MRERVIQGRKGSERKYRVRERVRERMRERVIQGRERRERERE